MSATIIDAFVATLGLDGTLFKKGMKDAEQAQDKLDKSTKKINKEREQADKKADQERKKREREEREANKKRVEDLKKVRNGVLAIATVFTAGVGIKNFIKDTINGAANLGYLGENLRMSTRDLTSWQKASERAGGSHDGIVAQLKESADTLAQLRSGFGPNEGLQNFFRFGGNADDLKDGNTYLLARSRIISQLFNQDPSKAALVARQMGILDDQFNFLKQGPAAVQALVQAQEKNAVITERDAKAAQDLRNKWFDLRDELQSTSVKVLVTLLPAFSKFVGVLEGWADKIAENRDVIASWADKLANFDWDGAGNRAAEFAGDVADITRNVKELIDRWDEWRGKPKIQTPGVTYLPGAIKAGPHDAMVADRQAHGEKVDPDAGHPKNPTLRKIDSVIDEALYRTLASFGVQSAKEWIRDHTGHDDYLAGPKRTGADPDFVRKRLEQYGWTKEQAAGITGSFLQENSTLDPSKSNPKSGAYGIGQWLGPRVADFKKWSGHDLNGSSIEEQLAFFQYEVTKGKEQDAGRRLRAAKTAEEAARIHSEAYERPGADEANVARRQRLAAQLAAGDRARNAQAVGSIPSGPAASAPVSAGSQTTTSTTEVHIDNVNIQTQATDAEGIAKEIKPAMQKYSFATQANSGMR